MLTMNLSNIPIGASAPNTVNAIIEIPRGSRNKYEYDDNLKIIRLDRLLHSAIYYPADYGFIPQTKSEDGDHLDCLVLASDPLFPGCLVEVKPVGVLDMEDQGKQDEKIIAVSIKDPKYANNNDITDIDNHTLMEIANFFKRYKELENKTVAIKKWLSNDEAKKIISQAQKSYSII